MPGQYYDVETGLHYNHYRYYNPRTGRYIEPDPLGLAGGINRYTYVENDPINKMDPLGTNPLEGALGGAEAGSIVGGLPGAVVGGIIGAIGGYEVAQKIKDLITNAKPPENARDPNGAKAPGKPGEAEGFCDPKGGENWVPNPNPGKGGSSHGWEDDKGRVWLPTGQGGRAHGGPHWDVQIPGGRPPYVNVHPDQHIDDVLNRK